MTSKGQVKIPDARPPNAPDNAFSCVLVAVVAHFFNGEERVVVVGIVAHVCLF